jgi:hypothetical protein
MGGLAEIAHRVVASIRRPGRVVNVWHEVTVLCVNPPSRPVNMSHIGWDVVDQPRSTLAASDGVLGRREEEFREFSAELPKQWLRECS